MSKRKHDKSDMSTPAGANQFKANAIRQTLSYDAYGSRTTFIVRVLTRPIPISADDFKTVMSAAEADVAMWEVDAQAATRIVFMGRILEDELGAPSPHATLPDPCQDWTISAGKKGAKPGCAAKIISWHTRFFSRSDYNGKVPGIGDKVRVTLSTGDFKYNLQNAYFETLESVELADNDEICQTNLNALFQGFNHDSLGDIVDISGAMAARGKFPNGKFATYKYSAVTSCKPASKDALNVKDYFGAEKFKKLIESISGTESGGSYSPICGKDCTPLVTGTNAQGYAGKYQMGIAALVTAKYMKPSAITKMKSISTACGRQHISCKDTVKVILESSMYWTGRKGVNSISDYIGNHPAQEDAMEIFTQAEFRSIKSDIDRSSPRDVAGMIAATHLKGAGGARKMRNDINDATDANGTSPSSYYKKHGSSVC
jgi:hypothetical protein